MCGRFDLNVPLEELRDEFTREPPAALPPLYNIAPTHDVAAIRWGELGRTWCTLRWGLIPHWAKDTKIGSRLINTRAETIATKPAYQGPFANTRCLIPATGFYEWKKTKQGKQPYRITKQDRCPFAFAGIWTSWTTPLAGEVIETCSIITTTPNEVLSEIHDRMPVILPMYRYNDWIEPGRVSASELQQMLVPYPAEQLYTHPVSTIVNSARKNMPECIVPVET